MRGFGTRVRFQDFHFGYTDMAEVRDGTAQQSTEPRGRAGEILTIATAAALLAAAAFELRWAFVWFVRREVVGVSRDVAWMAPVATLLVWLAIAIPSAAMARLLPREWALRLASVGFFSLSALSILLPLSAITRPAVGILSLGIGIAASRLVVQRPGTLAILRWGSLVFTLAFVVSAAAIGTSDWRSGEQRERPPAPAGAPNVLLIVLDAVRADALGSYESSRATTPHLDSLALEGTRFSHAIATAPWTRPTHRTLLTGRYPIVAPGDRSTFLARQDDDTAPFLAEWFRDVGYETAAFVANFYYTGWDAGFSRGFATYRDHPRTLEQVLRTSTLGQTAMARDFYVASSARHVVAATLKSDFTVPERPKNSEKSATKLTDEFLRWFDRREARPFFVFMNYYDAHRPYNPPAPYDRRFAGTSDNRVLYDGAVAYMDAEIARILATLRGSGVLDSTLVVITADHGELFGEHGLVEHTSSLYYKVLHVPLIFRWPSRIPARTVVERVVSLRDVARTITGLTFPARESPFPGVSLAPLWDGDSASVSLALSLVERGVRSDSTSPHSKGDLVSLFDGSWHYTRSNGTGREELYRYRDDPFELNDRVSDIAVDSVRQRLRDSLVRVIERGPAGASRD